MNKTILLVEDNSDDEILPLRALKKNSVANTVTVVRDGAEALDFLFSTGKYSGEDHPLPEVAMALTAKSWTKPSIGASKNEIEDGILCGVAKINLEQGLIAGRMALDILHGRTHADIPVTENQNGQRMINAATANRLGLQLKPMVLIETTLVQ